MLQYIKFKKICILIESHKQRFGIPYVASNLLCVYKYIYFQRFYHEHSLYL